MDNAKNGHLEVMKAEVPGPVFRVVSKTLLKILYIIYLALLCPSLLFFIS